MVTLFFLRSLRLTKLIGLSKTVWCVQWKTENSLPSYVNRTRYMYSKFDFKASVASELILYGHMMCCNRFIIQVRAVYIISWENKCSFVTMKLFLQVIRITFPLTSWSLVTLRLSQLHSKEETVRYIHVSKFTHGYIVVRCLYLMQ